MRPARQLGRFALVGVSNTAVSYLVFLLLLRGEAPYALATAAAFLAGAANGYVLNRRWTFAAPDSRRARLAYLLVQALALGATSTIVWSLVRAGVPAALAYPIAIPPVTLASFAANRGWIFAATRPQGSRGPHGPAPARPGSQA
jgi:putative flippase GtrA